jgi:hypothetical protein
MLVIDPPRVASSIVSRGRYVSTSPRSLIIHISQHQLELLPSPFIDPCTLAPTMSFPTPKEIKRVAKEHGYEERREEISSTLFFKDVVASNDEHNSCPTLVNVFYTTRGVMTKISHPKSGYNELWRSDAYDSPTSLAAIFKNPRMHTGKGYRTVDGSVRGCTKCGLQKQRGYFSKNQWRKGPAHSNCADCVSVKQNKRNNRNTTVERTESEKVTSSVEISRECIECDGDGCGRSSPAIRCTRCHLVYYCSEVCQRQHRSSHMHDCRDIDELRSNMHPEPSKDMLRGRNMAAQLAGRSDFEGLLHRADYYQDIENWEGAIEIYKSLYEEMIYRPPPEQRRVIMGFCRCFYEVGRYDHAIELGMSAIEMNRYFPEVHKYVALAQKANGDRIAARTTMKRAVIYETPWDDKNIAANKALLQEI